MRRRQKRLSNPTIFEPKSDWLIKPPRLGLHHTCELAPGTETDGMWIYQSVGGGAAVIEFDRDGWPDLTFANLDGQPLKERFHGQSIVSKPRRSLRGRHVRRGID